MENLYCICIFVSKGNPMKKIQSFFQKANAIIKEYNYHREEQFMNGELFNIFNITGLSANECKLHSALIAELLNPNGSHGCGNQFLKKFLQVLNLDDFCFNLDKIRIRTEKPVRDGRIDIEISDEKRAIIIEVKIYADDMDCQLSRYYHYAKKEYGKNFKLLYLTLMGNQASEKSLGNKNSVITHNDYICLSFADDILEWIDRCITIAKNKSSVKNILASYKQTIIELTGQNMNIELRNRLLQLMTDKENAESVLQMMNLSNEWLSAVIKKYVFLPLESFFNKKGLLLECEMQYGPSGCWIYKPEWKYYGIFIWTENNASWKDMYVGISWYNAPLKREDRITKYHQSLSCFTESPCKDYPFGWSNLKDEYSVWNYNTVPEMLNGNLVKYLIEYIEQILQELEDKNIELH